MNGPEIERLIQLLGRLPGLGPRSARRVALHLLKKREVLMQPLSTALADAARAIRPCSSCGNRCVSTSSIVRTWDRGPSERDYARPWSATKVRANAARAADAAGPSAHPGAGQVAMPKWRSPR